MDTDKNDVLDCEEGRYPYPDACVFVAIGLLRTAATRPGYTAALLRTYVAVSTQRRLVKDAFDRANPEFRSMLTLSLDELRERVTALRAMRTQRRSWAAGLLLRVVQPFAEPYLVAHNDVLDHIALDAVYASSVHGARAQVRHPIRAGMAVSLSHLEKTLAQMESVKTGDDTAPYHWDYSEAGDFVDTVDGSIFRASYSKSGTSLGPVAFGGVKFRVTRGVLLGGEVRYQKAEGTDLPDGFLGDRIDLSGFTYQGLVQFRF